MATSSTCIVKLNVDAVVTDDLAALVVVARDSSSEVLKVQTKLHELLIRIELDVVMVAKFEVS